MPKPAPINAATLISAKPPGHSSVGTLQRGETHTDKLVDLNFKVPPDFKREFKQLALDAGDLKQVQLLARMRDAYKREQGIN